MCLQQCASGPQERRRRQPHYPLRWAGCGRLGRNRRHLSRSAVVHVVLGVLGEEAGREHRRTMPRRWQEGKVFARRRPDATGATLALALRRTKSWLSSGSRQWDPGRYLHCACVLRAPHLPVLRPSRVRARPRPRQVLPLQQRLQTSTTSHASCTTMGSTWSIRRRASSDHRNT